MAYSPDLAKAPVERLDQAIKATQRPRPVVTRRKPLVPPVHRPKG
jgi:hypothetical protein